MGNTEHLLKEVEESIYPRPNSVMAVRSDVVSGGRMEGTGEEAHGYPASQGHIC